MMMHGLANPKFIQRVSYQRSSRGVQRLQNRRQIIRTVKYADGLVLLAKKEMVLEGMIDRLIEIGRCCGMKM
jgi:hypothetical protein